MALRNGANAGRSRPIVSKTKVRGRDRGPIGRLQFHIALYFWPEFAFNDMQWTSGVRSGRNQLFVGPGIVFGRFQINHPAKTNFGIA